MITSCGGLPGCPDLVDGKQCPQRFPVHNTNTTWRSSHSGKKKPAVRIQPAVAHRQAAGARVPQNKILVRKVAALEDAPTPRAVAICDVAALAMRISHHPTHPAALIVEVYASTVAVLVRLANGPSLPRDQLAGSSRRSAGTDPAAARSRASYFSWSNTDLHEDDRVFFPFSDSHLGVLLEIAAEGSHLGLWGSLCVGAGTGGSGAWRGSPFCAQRCSRRHECFDWRAGTTVRPFARWRLPKVWSPRFVF